MFCTDKGFPPQSGSGGDNMRIYNKCFPPGRKGRLVCSGGWPSNVISASQLIFASFIWVWTGLVCHWYLHPLPLQSCWNLISFPGKCNSLQHPLHIFWSLGCWMLIIVVWLQTLLLLIFKVAWKAAALLTLVTEKQCINSILLCIDNKCLFLPALCCYFFLYPSGLTNWPGHILWQIHFESSFQC